MHNALVAPLSGVALLRTVANGIGFTRPPRDPAVPMDGGATQSARMSSGSGAARARAISPCRLSSITRRTASSGIPRL